MSSVPGDGGGKGDEKSRDTGIKAALYPLRLRCGCLRGTVEQKRIQAGTGVPLFPSEDDSTFQPGLWGYLVCTGIV